MITCKEFLAELEKEALTTRKMLSIIPDGKYDWQPHPRSMPLGKLATHIAELPTWVNMVFVTTELDFATTPYVPREISDTKSLMNYFEENLLIGRKALTEANDEVLGETWTLRNGEQIISQRSKSDVIRMTFNQITHHRAQLGVYLRLLNIPIPGSYGPSADDAGF
ncbi:MAG: DinB family protein [Bacteroidota bacterium]|nr:DinB family protein [Bacteroidota bacterium]